LPHELDEMDLDLLRGPLYELEVYRAFQIKARDLNALSAGQLDLVAWVDELKNIFGY